MLSSSPLGRLQFFLYSAAIWMAELIGVMLCITATMGFDGFIHSKPGPSREGLALASLVVMIVFAAARANITWRRGIDADLSKWQVVPYIVALALLAVLQAATLLVYDFKTNNTDIGGILSIALLAWWSRICLATPRERQFDPDSFLVAEGLGEAPSGRSRHATPASVAAQPSMLSQPVAASAHAHGNAGGITFGKRGRG
jgi:hypothetical protein